MYEKYFNKLREECLIRNRSSGTRKKRWHTAGSFSTAFNIFQNSEAKPVRKS